MSTINTTMNPDNKTVNYSHNLTEEPNNHESLQEVMYGIQYVVMPILVIFGVIGNTITIITMSSKKFSHLTSRLILIALAVSDTLLLLTQPFNKLWIIQLVGSDLRAISNLSCKLFFVVFKASKMTSSWFVVLLCVERYVAVIVPLHSKLILKKRYICVAIFTIYVGMVIYNGVWSFSSMVVNGFCRNDIPSTEFKYFLIGACLLYSLIPTMILLVLTPQIVTKLVRQRRFQNNLTVGSQIFIVNRRNERMFRASLMMIAVMVAYVILVIPITTVHLYAFYNNFDTFHAVTRHYFIYREVAQILEQINYAINFVFYVVCSRQFREHMFEITGISKCFGKDGESYVDKNTEKSNLSGSESRTKIQKILSITE